MTAELVMVEQRRGSGDAASWIRAGGRTLRGRDGNERLDELSRGLARHAGVRAVAADAADETLTDTLDVLHDRPYLEALAAVGPGREAVLAEFAPPGLEPDIPVSAELVAGAREGVRTAITAAQLLLGGAHHAYAVCRPPGHHAGPAFLGGYCYLNNAAAAALILGDGGLGPVGILDLDLHYPNGTAALLDRLGDATLHSLHAAPVTNVAPGTVLPQTEGERAIAFAESPTEADYLAAAQSSVEALAAAAGALVVSLGFDTLGGDPHGDWGFSPPLFTEVGALLGGCGLPVCVVQEGGYALPALAACSDAFATGLLGAAERASAAGEREVVL